MILIYSYLMTTHYICKLYVLLHMHYRERNGVSNHQCLVCVITRLFRLTSKKTSKPAFLALCEGNPLVAAGLQKGSVTRKPFSFDNVIIVWHLFSYIMVSKTSRVFKHPVISHVLSLLSFYSLCVMKWLNVPHLSRGRLVLAKPLDRERHDNYKLNVRVSDGLHVSMICLTWAFFPKYLCTVPCMTFIYIYIYIYIYI